MAVDAAVRRLSRRARIEDRIGRDPAEVIHELVYRDGRSLKAAGENFGISESTAHRWLRDWMRHRDGSTGAVA